MLTLEQVSGAITFNLPHRGEMDRYLEYQRADYEAKRQAETAPPEAPRRKSWGGAVWLPYGVDTRDRTE